jgi:hypothetical protein
MAQVRMHATLITSLIMRNPHFFDAMRYMMRPGIADHTKAFASMPILVFGRCR